MGNIIYVRIGGDDAYDGQHPDNAVETFVRAQALCYNNYSIVIGPGFYTEPIIPTVANISWVGDRSGALTKDAPGEIQVPYFQCNDDFDNCSRNRVYYINFYGYYASGPSGVMRGYGRSVALADWSYQPVPDLPRIAPSNAGLPNFSGVAFTSCKFANGIYIEPSNRCVQSLVWQDVVFRSCLIGYSYDAGNVYPAIEIKPNQFDWHVALGPLYPEYKDYRLRKYAFYGCTILAPPNMSDIYVIDCRQPQSDLIVDAPTIHPQSTAVWHQEIHFVNNIVSSLTSAATLTLFRNIGGYRGGIAGTSLWFRGNHNLYLTKPGDSFSIYDGLLSDWKTRSITEAESNVDPDFLFYIDTDNKPKFALKTALQGDINQSDPIYVFDTIAHSTAIADNNWHHIAFSFDRLNFTKKLYLDGVAVTDVNADQDGGIEWAATAAYYLGGIPQADRSVRGYIDEVRLWFGAQSAGDLSSRANAELNPVTYPQLYHYWRCNNLEDDELLENIGNSTPTHFGTLVGATYSATAKLGAKSVLFTAQDYVHFRANEMIEQDSTWDNGLNQWSTPDSGSLTIEMWVKLTELPSVTGVRHVLFTKGYLGASDGNSISGGVGADVFQPDGYHLSETSIAKDVGHNMDEATWRFSSSYDIDGDPRPYGPGVDIGCDEDYPSTAPDHVDPYGFTSKVFAYISENLWPTRFECDFEFEMDEDLYEDYPGGLITVCNTQFELPAWGWKDWCRVLINFRPYDSATWIEVFNNADPTNPALASQVPIDLRGQEVLIPNSYRGPHFQVKFELYIHDNHLLKFDLGMEAEDAKTQTVTDQDLKERYPPGCEIDFYNFMFKEMVDRTVVGKDGSFTVHLWPGTYYYKVSGAGIAFPICGKGWVTVGFSDWYSPFGTYNCATPRQADWAEMHNNMDGMVWASWFMKEQFIDELQRISTEIPNAWPLEQYVKKGVVRCGRYIKCASWIGDFSIFTDPSLDIQGYETIEVWNHDDPFYPFD